MDRFSVACGNDVLKSNIKSNRRVLVLIGGTSGSGKSTQAMAVAQALSFERVIAGDAVRDFVRTHYPQSDHFIHKSSYMVPITAWQLLLS